MKNLFLTKTRWLVTIILLTTLGSGNVWGADYSFVSSIPNGWTTSPKPSGYETSNLTRGAYWTQNFSLTFAGVSNVTQIEITYSTNNNQKGFSVTVGGDSWGGAVQALIKGDRHATKTFSGSAASGDIVISCARTDKTIYVEKISITTGGGGDCSKCTYYVYNGSTWESIGTTGFNEVVLAPPTLDGYTHGGSNGAWTIYENLYSKKGCQSYLNNDAMEYRFVPNNGKNTDAKNIPGDGVCALYAVYLDKSSKCYVTTAPSPECARIWDEPVPATPSVSGSNVTLSWSSIAGSNGYHVYVTDGSWEENYDIASGTTTKTISDLAAGTYLWTVYAKSPSNAAACNSNEVYGDVFTIEGCTDISSSTVTGVSVTPSKEGGSATWTAVANASSYEVKVYAGTATSGVALFSAEPTSNSCTITGLNASTQYTVVVKAKNSCSTSIQGKATWTTSALTLYTVTFVNQSGADVSPATQLTEGGSVTLPSASPSAACAALGWTFAGWKDGSALAETTDTPTLIAAGSYIPSENKTFYAVFTKTEGGGGSVGFLNYTEVTSDPSDWSGNYLLYDGTHLATGSYASNALTWETADAPGSTEMSEKEFTLTKITYNSKTYYTLQNASGKYIGVTSSTSSKANLVSADNASTTYYYWTPSTSYILNLGATRYLGNNTTSAFKAYVTSNTSTNTPAKLYKRNEGSVGTTYWNSNPSCSSEATVTYDGNGNTGGTAPTDKNNPYTIGDEVTVLACPNTLVKTGKVFGCWNTQSDGLGTDYAPGATFNISGDITLYAKWVNLPYTVTFDAEGGTCGTSSLTEASGGAGVTLPAATATCAPAGWSFYGWATSTCSSTTSAPSIVGTTDETYYPTGNITLYAVYVNSGTYNSNPVCHEVTIGSHTNGTINVNSSTTSPQTVTQGTTVNIAATPESGYNFTTWTITKTTGGDDVTSTLLGANATTASTSFTMPDYDVTVSATFVAKVMRNIIWKNNGVELTDAERGSANTSMEVGEKLTAIPTLASGAVGKSCDTEGHPTFVGWTATPWNGEEPTAAGLFTADNLPTMPAGESPITYHAVWADGSGVFELVTSAPSNWSGTYLIVSGTKAMSSDFYEGESGEFKASEVTISNNKIECTDDKLIWIVAKNGDNAQYSFKNKNTGTYAKITGTKSTNAALDANAVWFTIENASGNVYDIVSVSNSARCFAYYDSNTSFRTYAKSSYNTGSLYKVSEATSYITSCSCPGYSMHFGTRGSSPSDWSDKDSYCFVASEDADGNTGVYWYLEDFELPAKPHYYLGWQGEWNTTDAKSADADFSDLVYGLLRANSCGTQTLGTYSSGNNQGAIGTLRVRSSYTDNNKYIDFIPGGYVLRLSDDNGSSYTNTEFVAASANLTETIWMTDITTISAALASRGKYFVGLKASSDHVWAPNMSEVANISSMGYKKDGGSSAGSWGTGLGAGMRGKFRIWADNCSKNWNAHFVPYYHLSYDGNGAGATNLPEASDDKSCEGNDAARTVIVSSTVPTRDGYTFVGWNTSANGSGTTKSAGDNVVLTSDVVLYAQWRQNFTVTYDLNGGAADPICSGGTYYVGQSVTVCSTTPTKTSSSFLGWKRLDTDAAVVGGSTFTMPSNNVTIQAQWETVYFHIYYKEEDGTAIATDDVPQTAETTLRNQTPCVGYTFFGWSTSKITSETTSKPAIIGKGGASYTPDADITVYPVYARSEGATTVKDTLTVANTGVTTSYTPVEGINKDKTPKTIHSNAVYAIGAYNSSGMQFTDGTTNEDQQKSSLITTTSGGSLQAIQARIPYAASTIRYLYTKGNTSDYTMQNRSSQGGTLAWTITHSTKADKWYSHDFSEDGYSSFFMYCGGGATKVDSIIVTWGTGTYYYATHCDTKENVTVTYNGNGGTVGCGSPADGAITSVTWDYKNSGADAPILASEQTICASATRSGGYVLRDWTTGADGTGTHYTPGASITSLANDITLYAQWDRVYTVTFNDQGVQTSVTQASAGASVAVPSNPTPCNTKPGVTWTFVGWGSQDGLVQSLNGHIVIPEGTNTYTPSDDITLYAVYRKSTGTSDAFAVGTSGAYTIGAKQGAAYAECLATARYGAGYNCKNDGTEPATIFYLNYINSGEHIGQYTMQDGNTGEYVCYSGDGTGLSWSSTTPYYYNVVANGTGWNLQFSTATGRYFTHETGSIASSFKAYQSKNPVTLHPAAASTYYTVASCDDDFNITFVAQGSEITWQVNHGEGTYYHLADGTEVSVFPTASFDGWTFLGWRTADYDESTTAPSSAGIYGGSDGTSGNAFTIHSNTNMYPVFTRFEDNEPFDQINGGDYYIYFLDENQKDEYGAYKRVYAASYSDQKRYNSTSICSNATEFTFTKLANGNWTIYDKTTKMYLYGVAGDDLKQQASATGAEWTLTVNGNQFDAFHVGTSYGQITASGDGTSATFMNYRRTNIGPSSSYHRVYLGGCTNRTFTTNPATTPNIEIHGQVKVTSTADKSIKAASVLTVSATNIATANLTLTSDNSAFKFSLTSNGTYTESVNIPVVSNKVGVTPIYVEYTPTLTTDGIEEATITVSDGASPTPTTATTESGDVQGRHLPTDFVIAAKIGNNWYALPADCSTSTSSTAGVLIEVDNPSDPTCATGAPMNTKYGLQPVRPSRVGGYGNRLVFTEHLSTQITDNQKTLYNGAATSIQVNAMYANYIDTNPDQYEWIPTTTDLKDYTLTSAKTFDGDAAARTVSLNTSGVFGTLLLAKAYNGKVRLLPATFYEPAEVQILKWKTNSVIVMYTGTDNATTKVGENPESSSQALGSHKLTHGIYEFTTNEALTTNAGQTLRITLGSSRLEVEIPLIITGNTTAAADGKDVVILDGAKFTAAATKYSYRNVYVYGGGKLDIPSGTSLGVNNIILRAGGVTTNGSGGNATYAYVYPQVKLVGTLTSTQTNIKYEYVTDYDHWYHLCLPFNALTSTIQYPQEYYGSNVAADNHGSWVIKRYDGATRATGNYDAWVDIESNGEPTPTTVTAGHGYIFWGAPKKVSVGGGAATRQAWGIQRMTMAITSAAAATTAETNDKNISVDSYSNVNNPSNQDNDRGWNLVGNPYMVNLTDLSSNSLIAGKLVHTETNPWDGKWMNNGDGVRYVTIPDNHFDSYVAKTASVASGDGDFMPGRAFFVQIKEGASTLTFAAANRASLTPARFAQTAQSVDIETGIVMSDESKHDEVNFWIKEDKSAEYEYNADYPKTPNKTNFNIYGVHQSGNLSWVAISPAIAESDMAIGYQVPAAGDYTLSLSEKYIAEEIESVFVTDHGVSPELTTDLMVNTYTFTVHQAETNNERFTVSIKVREEDNIATDIGNSTVDTHAVKFIRDDKMYILRNGLLYDATGKRVNGINK